MEMMAQNGLAFLIVGIAAFFAMRSFYRKYAVAPLSGFLLKRGRVALAMRIRQGRPAAPGCGQDCGCD